MHVALFHTQKKKKKWNIDFAVQKKNQKNAIHHTIFFPLLFETSEDHVNLLNGIQKVKKSQTIDSLKHG